MLLLLILWGLFYQASFGLVESLNFSFSSFDAGSCRNGSNLICMGKATAGNGSLTITPFEPQEQQQENLYKIGRVLYRDPVVAWPASFSTIFTARIVPQSNSSRSGDGMAFIIAQDNKPSPNESVGSYIGIMDGSTQGGVLRQLAVELDTYKNENEQDGNHIAIDTISITEPLGLKSLNGTGINLKSGRDITVEIKYDGWSKVLQISVAYAGDPLLSFLNKTIIMKDTVPSSAYVGFTASTGALSEVHHILDWNFTTYILPEDSLKYGIKHKDKTKVALMIVIPIVGGFFLIAALASPFVLRAHRRRKERIRRRKEDFEILARNAANAPILFTYRQLAKATHNFNSKNLLGSGGFGSVYKGVISDPPTTIAVKKISTTSRQGEKEYLAEISTIGRLRHKNLVKLQGWCHDHEELLLVYEYMPNGSLDRYIGKIFLDWETRYKILKGLASVLVYLHEECGNPVVHRDVKPNNVMLDCDYNARLGDFGLARLIWNDASVSTIMAGTPGYVAPEVSYTGRARPEADVYSFGMVALEVVCGRRSKDLIDDNGLLDYVWTSYEQGALLSCVDQMLEGEFDEEQVRRTLVVGLACSHLDYKVRPRMRKAAQIFLNPDEPLVNLPESRPSSVCVQLYFSSNCNSLSDFVSTSTGSKSTVVDSSSNNVPGERSVESSPWG